MPIKPEPAIGNWYETADSLSFKVIHIDEGSETIEIQYLDGAHEEIDFDAWKTLEVESIVPPKDWEGLCNDDLDDYLNNDYMDNRSSNDESWDNEDELVDEDSEIKEY